MCSLRKALRLAGQQMGEWPRKPLFWLALALNLNFTLEPAVALIRASQLLGEPLQVLEPYLQMTSYIGTCFLWMIGLVIFLSDAPFLDERATYVGLRMGRGEWLLAQLLYVAAACLLYALVRLAFALALTIPYAYSGNLWSSTLWAIANNEGGIAYQLQIFFPNKYMMTLYTPYAFLGLSLGLQSLYCLTIGMMVFALNLVFRKGVGIAVALCVHNLGYFIAFDGSVFANQRWSLLVHSLGCFHDINQLLIQRFPAFWESFALFLGLIGGLAALCAVRASKIDFSVPYRNL